MKSIPVVPLVLALAAIMFIASTPGKFARNRPMARQRQAPVQDLAAPDTEAQQVQLFVGQIMKKGGEFLLWDATSATAYNLDNQREAGQFNGRKVKVEGKLDTSSNTIQVSSIEPAPGP